MYTWSREASGVSDSPNNQTKDERRQTMKTENKFGISGFGVSGKELAHKSRRKWELLEHYASREPVRFIQIDDFCDPGAWDSVVTPDEDGHSIWSGITHELMTGIYNIRLLIRPDTSIDTVLGFLKKMTQRLSEKDFVEFYHHLLAQEEDGGLIVRRAMKLCNFCGCDYEEDKIVTMTKFDGEEYFICKPCLKDRFRGVKWQDLYLDRPRNPTTEDRDLWRKSADNNKKNLEEERIKLVKEKQKRIKETLLKGGFSRDEVDEFMYVPQSAELTAW